MNSLESAQLILWRNYQVVCPIGKVPSSDPRPTMSPAHPHGAHHPSVADFEICAQRVTVQFWHLCRIVKRVGYRPPPLSRRRLPNWLDWFLRTPDTELCPFLLLAKTFCLSSVRLAHTRGGRSQYLKLWWSPGTSFAFRPRGTRRRGSPWLSSRRFLLESELTNKTVMMVMLMNTEIW
jgi:hypothetical protein